MAISARAQKAGVIGGVFFAGGAKVADDFALRLLAGNVEIAREAVLGWNAGEQIVDGARADLGQHLEPLIGGFG